MSHNFHCLDSRLIKVSCNCMVGSVVCLFGHRMVYVSLTSLNVGVGFWMLDLERE